MLTRRRVLVRSFFDGEVGVQVDLGGVGALVAEPERDHREIDVGVQQAHRGAVTQD